MHKPNHKYILTGPPGAGKSTVLAVLRSLDVSVVEEPARKILAEQRAISGLGLPEADARLFTELMVSRSVSDYENAKGTPTIFDRGIPDYIAYAKIFNLPYAHLERACELYPYNKTVFFAPIWPKIYATDEERKMTCEEAADFGDIIRKIYETLGYEIVELPKLTPKERAERIMSSM